jgi:KDO2-lipid IV(A) lauroyltransferase
LKQALGKKLKHDLIYYFARVLIFFLGLLPFSLAGKLGWGFGAFFFWMVPGERRKTLRHIRMAFPKNFTGKQIRKLAFRVWVNVGRNLFEVVRWLRMTREEIVSQVARCHGWGHLEKALRRGKGALVVTGHLGNWELLGTYLAFRHAVSGVAQNLYDPRFDRMLTSLREKKMGASIIKRGIALRGILEALKKNQVVMALCDQDTGKDGVFVPFFGKEAWTQSGVARIAQKTGAALIPAFLVRGADDKFELHVEKEIKVPQTGDREKDMLETVRRYTEVIERYVRAYPDQWVWMHDRWKTRPPDEKN